MEVVRAVEGEEDESDDTDEDDADEEMVVKHKAPKGISEYQLRRQNNIEENKKLLEEVKKKHPIREVKGVKKDKIIDKASQSLVTGPGDATPASPTSIATADQTTSAKDNTAKPANDALHPANETAQPANPGNNSADSNAPVLPTSSELTTGTISTTIATA